MCEQDAVAVDCEHACGLSGHQLVDGTAPEHRRDPRCRRLREDGSDLHGLHRAAEPIEPLADDVQQGVRQRQFRTRRRGRAADQRPAEQQREHRVATGHLVDAAQSTRWQVVAQTFPHDRVELPGIEGANRSNDDGETELGIDIRDDAVLEPQACGDQESDRCIAQAARDEGEHSLRGMVHPMKVVDRHDDRTRMRPLLQQAEQCERNGARRQFVTVRLRPQEGDFEGAVLRGGKDVEIGVRNVDEQVGQRREGELRLGLHGTALEHLEILLPRQPDALPPEGRLADARLPREHERGGPIVDRIDERANRPNLVGAADDRAGVARQLLLLVVRGR